ncbi:MAG: hypothetical protein MZW92_13470 [Comamonadaceae bacterium]|nr:hypothetical protein [Comamonadaceae bacterium]
MPEQIGAVLRNTELQRLNFGIFSLHAAMRGLFVVIPLVLRQRRRPDGRPATGRSICR